MKRLLLILSFLYPFISSFSQSRIWAIGTAVPGGSLELTPFPNKQFKYTGQLTEGGTLRFCTAENPESTQARFLKPSYEDAYAVTNATPFTLVSDSTAALWTVPITENVYRITIDVNAKKLTGELFRPWNELFIAGGATECGWVSYTFLPFTRDENEVCAWDWTGELKERQEFGEPRRFKFEGQNYWEPKELHPFTQDEDILQSTQLMLGVGIDNKWSIRQEGYYHIRVDVFRETVQAEYLGAAPTSEAPTAVDEIANRKPSDNTLYDLQGRQISRPTKGIFIKDGKKLVVR